MANPVEIQRINDSTVQKLTEIVENYNRNYRNDEIIALRKEITKIEDDIEMWTKIINDKSDSNQGLTNKFLERRQNCNIHVAAREHQIKRMKTLAIHKETELQQAKMFYGHALNSWKIKEERYASNIRKMNVYIDNLHFLLEQNGIFNDDYIEEEHNENELNQSEDEAIYDDFVNESMELNESQYHEEIIELSEASQVDKSHEETEEFLDETDKFLDETEELLENPMTFKENKSTSTDEILQECNDSNSQELSWCDMIEDEETCQLDDPVQADAQVEDTSDAKIKIEDDPVESDVPVAIDQLMSKHQASLGLNTETQDEISESNVKQNESEATQKLNTNDFVHSYVEREKSKSKSKKKQSQRERKPKSKPKFSNLISFGGY